MPFAHVTASVPSATRKTSTSSGYRWRQPVSTSHGPTKSSSSAPSKTATAIRTTRTLDPAAGGLPFQAVRDVVGREPRRRGERLGGLRVPLELEERDPAQLVRELAKDALVIGRA